MPTLDRDLAIILFQCARELVYNVAKHAQASAGRIALDIQDQTLQLAVSDNGRGFPSIVTVDQPGVSGGYGLFSVRERLALLGGNLSIASDTVGACVSIRAPLTPSRDNSPFPVGEVLRVKKS
jgi:signal transduction histidine kinase